MKVALLSYPMLFQHEGGLQIQVRETLRALNALECEAKLIDPTRDRLADFDVCHIFSAINGNFRIVESCTSLDVPVVLSPLLRPHWTTWLATRAKWCARASGRITGWNVRSEFQEIEAALRGADRLVALGKRERKSMIDAFGVESERIDIVPNGISAAFFDADPQPFLALHDLRPGFVLCVASINAHKNQLGLAHALAGMDRTLVMIGPCRPPQRAYLEQVLAVPGTRYVGSLAHDDPLLASAYAAAGVFCLPSQSEVMPLCVLESLAAGTPAVLTKNHAMDTDALRDCVTEVSPESTAAIRAAIEKMLASPPSSSTCRKAVEGSSWESVAMRLIASYGRVLAEREPRRASVC